MKIIINERQLKKMIDLSFGFLNENYKTQRIKFIEQTNDSELVDEYLNYFDNIRKARYKSAYSQDINIPIPPDVRRFDIDKYHDFYDVIHFVDYVKGQDKVLTNLGKSPYPIEMPGEIVYKNDEIEIYRANTKQACIKYKGNKPYGWCISANSGNMFNYYRFGNNSTTFYFVKDIKETETAVKKLENNDKLGFYENPYHIMVIQTSPYDDNYVVTSAKNDGDNQMTWNEIVKIQPKLLNLRQIFENKPVTQSTKDRIRNLQYSSSFDDLSYEDKEKYVDMDYIMTLSMFKGLPDNLKYDYISVAQYISEDIFNFAKKDTKLLNKLKRRAKIDFDAFMKDRLSMNTLLFSILDDEDKYKAIEKISDDENRYINNAEYFIDSIQDDLKIKYLYAMLKKFDDNNHQITKYNLSQIVNDNVIGKLINKFNEDLIKNINISIKKFEDIYSLSYVNESNIIFTNLLNNQMYAENIIRDIKDYYISYISNVMYLLFDVKSPPYILYGYINIDNYKEATSTIVKHVIRRNHDGENMDIKLFIEQFNDIIYPVIKKDKVSFIKLKLVPTFIQYIFESNDGDMQERIIDLYTNGVKLDEYSKQIFLQYMNAN